MRPDAQVPAPTTEDDYEALFHELEGAPAPLDVEVGLATATLRARLYLPVGARGLVVMAHGSERTRGTTHHEGLAERLAARGWACLLADLLTDEEDRDGRLRFEVPFLAGRVGEVLAWGVAAAETADLRAAVYGHGTGAATAAVAAASAPERVAALIACGGRLDYAGDVQMMIASPTLLLAGDADALGLDVARLWAHGMLATRELVVLPGVGREIEDPAALDEAAVRIEAWLEKHVAPSRTEAEAKAKAGVS